MYFRSFCKRAMAVFIDVKERWQFFWIDKVNIKIKIVFPSEGKLLAKNSFLILKIVFSFVIQYNSVIS